MDASTVTALCTLVARGDRHRRADDGKEEMTNGILKKVGAGPQPKDARL